ncbi:P-loop containing nucleoside triphosphate hydrolase protein [Hypoxylon sp. FL0890]|nr:P-loop containing nucleoside triphosphate hydrolase protein [Hypoxylon sp. FL0890]
MSNHVSSSGKVDQLEISEIPMDSLETKEFSEYSIDSSSTAPKLSGDALIHSDTRDRADPSIEGRKAWFPRLNIFRSGVAPPAPEARTVCPEASASWFSRLTFSWVKPLLSVGRKRSLEANDIWLVNPDRSIEVLNRKFEASFSKHSHDRHALAFALYDVFAREFWIGGIWQLIASLCQISIPLALRSLLSFVTDSYESATARGEGYMVEGPPFWKGLALVVGLLLLQLVQGIGINQFSYHGLMLGAQATGVLVAAMFEKSTKLSSQPHKVHGSNQGTKAGSTLENQSPRKELGSKQHQRLEKRAEDTECVINLMSSDTGHINDAAKTFHLVWTAPITIVLATTIIFYNLTYSALPGICLLLAGIPGLTLAVKSAGRLQPMVRKSTNARVSLTQEALRHVNFIKYNAWESYLLNNIRQHRTKELGVIMKLLTIKDIMHAISTCLPVFAALLSLTLYSATGHQLTAPTVFSSVVVFNTLRLPFASLSTSARQVSDGWAALKRLQDFLLAEEVKEDTTWDRNLQSAVNVKRGNFAWRAPDLQRVEESRKPNEHLTQRGPFTLTDIDFSIARGELVAVVGTTGSGKSSLLSALAGQIPKIGGEVAIGVVSRVVCSQNAWIQSASLRDNILFGKPMDRALYDRTIKSCALTVDIEALPAGENTDVGERGASLSGGQRQRINLARAIYARSDLVLLDDPLSAVDAHVAQHLFKEAICGALKGKTRVLVTHQRQFLPKCDRILWMENGRIRAMDQYSKLFAAEPDFRTMLAGTTQDVKEGKQEDGRVPRAESTASKRENRSHIQAADNNRPLDNFESGGARGQLVLKAYIRSSGRLINGFIPAMLLILAQGTSTLTNLWLSYWTSNKFQRLSRKGYVAIYIILATMQAVLILCFAVSLSILGIRASRRLQDQAVAKIIGAPMTFHDIQPLGQIVNLFTQDAEVVDQQLPDCLCKFLLSIAVVSSVCVLSICYFPWFAIALIPLAVGLFHVTTYYRPSARQLKRHEVLLRGIMFSRFSESVSGMQIIRAYGGETRLAENVRDAVDDMNATTFLIYGAQRWLAVWLDLISASMVLTASLLVISSGGMINPSISGVVLSSVLALRIQTQLIVQHFGEFEDYMASTEHLHYYCTRLPQESSQPATALASEVPKAWPTNGKIEMADVNMRYRPELPVVLKGVSINIQGGEKIGIVGRTGAGKSSLATALFRLAELSWGKITIDGLDIKQIPLSILRSRLSMISQDPILFRGTIRSNLDPFGTHTDADIWNALHQVGVNGSSTTTAPVRLHLDADVEEGGANYSQGQRQLLSIARALLRNTRIIICDEATSSLDPETEAKIQDVMSKAFSNKTVLTIAHRLQTVLNYDRICVLDGGCIAELDTPIGLWERHGIFRRMCNQMGIKRSDFDVE